MTQILKQGDRGALVSLLQLGLTRAGQTPGALDGIFGAQTAAAVRAFQARFPTVERIMLGRGLAANPGLIGQLRTGAVPTAAQFQAFHDRLYAATRARIPDRRALLFRMKEAWRYLGCSFADAERPLRRIRKAQDLAEYESAVRQLFASCPVRENAGYFI